MMPDLGPVFRAVNAVRHAAKALTRISSSSTEDRILVGRTSRGPQREKGGALEKVTGEKNKKAEDTKLAPRFRKCFSKLI
mmetsp:Transcript_19295/g.48283  ORF Transcript_19295/g.48283 Transcript_19295/m.48283 type:complete len:80 (+) Transcript_19295:654-893(+)